MDIRKLQRAIVDGLEDVKAQNIVVFNTEALSPLFERVIIASGNSNRQTRALANSVRETVKQRGLAVLRTEGEDNAEWIIVDCGAAVAHIMQPAVRDYYHLEEIWGVKPVKLKAAGDGRDVGNAKAVAVKKPPPPATAAIAEQRAATPRPAAPRHAAAPKPGAKKVAGKKAPAKKVLAKKMLAKGPVPKKASGPTPAAAKRATGKPAAGTRAANSGAKSGTQSGTKRGTKRAAAPSTATKRPAPRRAGPGAR